MRYSKDMRLYVSFVEIADLVERCKVIGVSFHQVIGPGMCCQTPISDPDTQGNNVLPGSQEGLQACMPESAQEQDFPAAALQLPHHNAAEATIGPEDFEEAKVVLRSCHRQFVCWPACCWRKS